jgi:hypothetical protein
MVELSIRLIVNIVHLLFKDSLSMKNGPSATKIYRVKWTFLVAQIFFGLSGAGLM